MNVSICGGQCRLQTELGIEWFPLLRRVLGSDCKFIVPDGAVGPQECNYGVIKASGAHVKGMNVVGAKSTKSVFAILWRRVGDREDYSVIEEAINSFPGLSHVLSPSLCRYTCNIEGTTNGQDLTTFVPGFHLRKLKGVAVWALLEFAKTAFVLETSGYRHRDLSHVDNFVFDTLKQRCVFIDVGLEKATGVVMRYPVEKSNRGDKLYMPLHRFIQSLWHYAKHYYSGEGGIDSDLLRDDLAEYQVLGRTKVVKITPTVEFLRWQAEVARSWTNVHFEDPHMLPMKKFLGLPRPPMPSRPFVYTACDITGSLSTSRMEKDHSEALQAGYDLVLGLYDLEPPTTDAPAPKEPGAPKEETTRPD